MESTKNSDRAYFTFLSKDSQNMSILKDVEDADAGSVEETGAKFVLCEIISKKRTGCEIL